MRLSSSDLHLQLGIAAPQFLGLRGDVAGGADVAGEVRQIFGKGHAVGDGLAVGQGPLGFFGVAPVVEERTR